MFLKSLPVFACILFSLQIVAQVNPDAVYSDKIRSVRFHMYGNQETMPVYKLNSSDKLELHFDDMAASCNHIIDMYNYKF